MNVRQRLESWLRPELRDFASYSSARSTHSATSGVMLDANENALWSYDTDLNRYPDPLQQELKQALSNVKGVARQSIFVSNGSDESIDLLIRAFCTPGRDQVLTMPPTYGMYQVFARLNDVDTVEVPLSDLFQINVAAVLNAITPNTKLMILASPNNPTGNCFRRQDLYALLKAFDGLLVVDEAYIDFCPDQSLVPDLAGHDNLVILQTLSKAWGAASLRVGMALAQPELVDLLTRIKPPYNVSGTSQAMAARVLSKLQTMHGSVAAMTSERDRLAQELQSLSCVSKVYPSDANFLLVRFAHARVTYDYLRQRGIVVRDRSGLPGCAGCLRITIGTADQNDRLLQALSTQEVPA